LHRRKASLNLVNSSRIKGVDLTGQAKIKLAKGRKTA
jgi:hypothetical protein